MVTTRPSDGILAFVDDTDICVMEQPPLVWSSIWNGTNTIKAEVMEMLAREYQISASSNWASSDAFGSIIWQSDIVETLLDKSMIRNIAEAFRYFRYKEVEVSIRMQSTPWHYGALVLYDLPFSDETSDYRDSTLGVQFANNNPMIISASQATTVIKRVGWHLPAQWVRYTGSGSDNDNISRFILKVLHPLLAIGASTPTVRFTVWARFIEPEVMGPYGTNIAERDVKVRAQSSVIKKAGKKKSGRKRDTKATVHEEAKAKSESGLMSAWREFTEGVKLGFDTVEYGVSKLGGIGALISLLDKPTSLMAANPVILRPYGDLPYGRGLDSSIKLSLDPECNVSLEPGTLSLDKINPTVLEMCMLPGLIRYGSFTGSSDTGAAIASFPLRPTVCHENSAVALHIYQTPTFMAWHSKPFRYWRGGMRCLIRFTTSQYISARVRVIWVPDNVSVPATISGGTGSDWVQAIIDVQGDTELAFTVPWLCSTMYRPVCRNFEFDADSERNGSIAMYVENTVVSVASTVTPTIYYHVYLAAAEDFQLIGLDHAYSTVVSGHTSATLIAPDIPDILPEVTVRAQSCVWTKFKDNFPPIVQASSYIEEGLCAGEYVKYVTEPMKRMSLQTTMYDYSTLDVGKILFWPMTKTFLTDLTIRYLPLDYYFAGCFFYYRGGRRFRLWYHHRREQTVVSTDIVDPTSYKVETPSGATGLYNGVGKPGYVDGVGTFLSWEVPWCAPFPYLPIWGEMLDEDWVPWNDNMEQITKDFLTSGVVALTAEVDEIESKNGFSTAAADDYAVGYVVPPFVMDILLPAMGRGPVIDRSKHHYEKPDTSVTGGTPYLR